MPHSYAWTRLQKLSIITAGVMALIVLCAAVFIDERDYRGPSGNVFCGTWEMPLLEDQVYLQLNADHSFSMFGLDDGRPNDPFARGRWYAGGPNIYLRFDGEDLLAGRPWVFQIVDIQAEQFQVRFTPRYGGPTDIVTFRRAHLSSPPASNHAMERTADRLVLNF